MLSACNNAVIRRASNALKNDYEVTSSHNKEASSHVTLLSLVKCHRDSITRTAHDFRLMILRKPVAPVLDPIILL